MSGRGEEEVAAAAERPANAVLRRGRRSRLGPGGDTQRPAAQRRRVEETPQRQRWPLTSTVEDVMTEGLYDSVLNAQCSHVLEFHEGEGSHRRVRMEVKAGQ
ncbi:putative retrotransposon hot spot (RHS) protein, partial [Trypanosoma conorhini]